VIRRAREYGSERRVAAEVSLHGSTLLPARARLPTMIKTLEDAIAKVKKLSPERQQYAAEVLEQIAEAGDAVYVLSDEERALVREGLAELDRGEAATDEEVRAVYDKYRA